MNLRIDVMKSQIAAASFVALFFSVGTANAIEMTNYDEDDKTITIVEAGVTAEAVIKAGASAKDICMSGCVLQLGTDPENSFEFSGNEIVSIEGNVVYDDTPEAGDVPINSDAAGFGSEVVDPDTREEEVKSDEATQ